VGCRGLCTGVQVHLELTLTRLHKLHALAHGFTRLPLVFDVVSRLAMFLPMLAAVSLKCGLCAPPVTCTRLASSPALRPN
jgi:hypothetical protein